MNTFAELPNTWLNKFEIELTSASDLQYANGRQQVEITLSVQARTTTVITDTEFASLCIVELRTDGIFIPLSTMSVANDWWQLNERNEYDYLTNATATADPTFKSLDSATSDNRQAQPVRQKKIYPVTLAPGGSTKRLWAQITKDTGEVYVTDNIFVSDVKLTALSPPRLSATSDYIFNRTLVSGSESSGIFIYEVQLHPLLKAFKSATLFPEGMIQWTDKDATQYTASYVAYAGPSEANFRHNENIVTGAHFVPASNVSHTDGGKITVLLQGGTNIPYHSGSANTQNGPCTVSAIDVNGNSHSLKIRFKGESGFENRTELTLLDA